MVSLQTTENDSCLKSLDKVHDFQTPFSTYRKTQLPSIISFQVCTILPLTDQ